MQPKNRPKPGKTITVAQGESVATYAAVVGHAPSTIVRHPRNESLMNQDRDECILAPGDRLYIPALRRRTLEVPAGSQLQISVQMPRFELRLQLFAGATPRANQPWTLRLGTRNITGTTDDAGTLTCPVPMEARGAALSVGAEDDTAHFDLRFHSLDPISTTAGIQERLSNLGYRCGPTDGLLGPKTRAALRAFQRTKGIHPTGEPCAATRSALLSDHGS